MAPQTNAAYSEGEARARSWPQLDEEKRRSNLAQARALYNRFRDGDAWRTEPVDLQAEAEWEHRRWLAYVLTAGFRSRDTQIKDLKVNIRNPRNPSELKLRDLARENPNITAPSKLPETVKPYNRNLVERRPSILRAFDVRQPWWRRTDPPSASGHSRPNDGSN